LKEKFKLDENLPEAALALFRKNDFDAANVIEEQLAGATDECILTVCGNENRVLVTQDLDFSDITLLSRTEKINGQYAKSNNASQGVSRVNRQRSTVLRQELLDARRRRASAVAMLTEPCQDARLAKTVPGRKARFAGKEPLGEETLITEGLKEHFTRHRFPVLRRSSYSVLLPRTNNQQRFFVTSRCGGVCGKKSQVLDNTRHLIL